MDKKTAIEKIRKCLALSKSHEPHEAAAAMRQAQKLMREFGIEHPEVLASGVGEEWAKSAATTRPPRFEVGLASVVAGAFACELVFSRRANEAHTKIQGGYVFIGVPPAAEIAQYTFSVLARQLRAARTSYVATRLKRCGQKNKVARADAFCEGWVAAVRRLIDEAPINPERREMIEAFMRVNYAATKQVTQVARVPSKRVDPTADRISGYLEGESAKLYRGVGGGQTQLALDYASPAHASTGGA